MSRRAAGGRAAGGAADRQVDEVLLGALDEAVIAPGRVEALGGAQQRVLVARARALLPVLRGQDQQALARLVDRRGDVETARRRSRSWRPSTRARSGEVLGDAADPTAWPALLELLHDPNPQVRLAAVRSLGRFGNPAAVAALLASVESKAITVDAVADAVLQIPSCPASAFRQGLESPSEARRAVSVEVLGRLQGLAATDDVIRLLRHDPSPLVRARAARCLGRLGTPRSVGALLDSLDSPDDPPVVRAQAIWALGEIGAPEAVPALRGVVRESAPRLSGLAAAALMAMGPVGVAELRRLAEGAGPPAALAAQVLATGPRVHHPCPELGDPRMI